LTIGEYMPVELKDIGHNISQQMRDGEPPLTYQAQVQAQMAILEAEKADLACFMDGRDFEVFRFERNDRFIKAMLAEVAEFHERLQEGNPPPVDGHPSTRAALAMLHPDDNGATVQFSQKAIEAAVALDIVKMRLKELDAVKTLHENVIKAEIGDATFGEAPGLRYSWKTQERAGHLKLPDTDEVRAQLAKAGLEFKESKGSKFRVLRPLKVKA
jgi:predicted phage-related endonuclease